eukprot:4559485-Pyramimonas_sp.AAC.1
MRGGRLLLRTFWDGEGGRIGTHVAQECATAAYLGTCFSRESEERLIPCALTEVVSCKLLTTVYRLSFVVENIATSALSGFTGTLGARHVQSTY